MNAIFQNNHQLRNAVVRRQIRNPTVMSTVRWLCQVDSSNDFRAARIIATIPSTQTSNAVWKRRSFSSVSESEVNKFSEFSKTWWDPRHNPLIGMNAVRVQYIVDELRSTTESNQQNDDNNNTNTTNNHSNHHDRYVPPLTGLSALDVGCGGGLLSESLARLGATVTAVDPSIQLVQQAKTHAQLDPKTTSIDYRGGYTVEQLAQEHQNHQLSSSFEGYDVICLLEVVEHVTDVHSVLSSVRSLLKPNTGRLFVSTMNRTVKSNLLAIVGAEYIMGYLPPGTHDWNQFRSPAEIQQLMDEAGLEQVNVNGMVLTKPPLCGQWDWKLDPSDVDVNWIGTYKVKSEDIPQQS